MGSSRMAFQMALMVSMILTTSLISALDECFCSAQIDLVCATNGEVFSNVCMLKCYNSENNANLEVEKAGHCEDLFGEGAKSSMFIPENSGGGAADVCLFTRDYKERSYPVREAAERNFSTNKERARRSRNYFLLLVVLCCIECAVFYFTQLVFAKVSQFLVSHF